MEFLVELMQYLKCNPTFTVVVSKIRPKTYLPSEAALTMKSALCKSSFLKTKITFFLGPAELNQGAQMTNSLRQEAPTELCHSC